MQSHLLIQEISLIFKASPCIILKMGSWSPKLLLQFFSLSEWYNNASLMKSTHWIKKNVQAKKISTLKGLFWHWKWGQGHLNIIILWLGISASLVKSIHWFKRYQPYGYGNNEHSKSHHHLKNYVKVTKTVSVLHFSHWRFLTSLLRIKHCY